MGTKKPSWTLFDTLSAHISSDRSHRTGRKSRDPSPRPSATAPTERDRTREEEWREREMERLKQDKARSKRKDTDPRERYPSRERSPAPRVRQGERDRRDKDGRQVAETRPNGRPVSHFETRVIDRETERARNKGDTFPRMRKDDDQRDRRRDQFGEKDAARDDRGQMERQQRTARRERQVDGERYKDRDGDKNIGRPIEDRTVRQRDRPRETDPGSRERRRERDLEVNNRKEKDMVRERDRLKPNMGERQGPHGASPRRRPERELYSDHEGRAEGRAGKRGTRSEGDSDEEMSKKTQKERAERNEWRPRHSRSEGEDRGREARERDRDGQRYREKDRQRDTGRYMRQEEGRDRDGRKERERERRRDGEREPKGARNDDRQREREWYRDGEGEERKRQKERSEREASPRRVRAAGRGSPPRAQSSGEWSSDVDSDRQRQRVREEDRESGRERVAESEREAKGKGGSASAGRGLGGGTERGQEQRQRGERPDRERGEERTGQRKMWLEPGRGKYSQGSSLEDEVGEERTRPGTGRGREGHREKEELDERYSDPRAPRVTHSEQRGREREEEEGVSVDREEVREAWARKDRGRGLGDEGGSCDSSEFSGSERGSGTDGERDKMLSGEDSFVTASSGGDEEDERLYRDSRESWEVGHSDCKGHRGEREVQEGWREGSEDGVQGKGDGREGKKPTFVFCVIGQTLPRSDRSSKSPDLSADTSQSNSGSSVCGDNITHSDSPPIPSRIDQCPNINADQDSEAEREADNLNEARAYTADTSREIRYTEPNESETGGGATGKVEHPYAEIGPIRKNSETEKLLAAWREREALLKEQAEKERERLATAVNPYDEVGYQGDSAPVLAPSDENGPADMCPEEKEVAFRIRMSGAWSMAEEAKRHSQAPHLKWAKNVVFEILGSSEEHAIADDPQPGSREGQEVHQPDKMPESEQPQEEQEEEEEEEMVAEGAGEMPVYATVQKQKADNQNSEFSEGEGEAELLEMEELRGTGQRQTDMHADQVIDMHGDTAANTHTDTLLDTEPSSRQMQVEGEAVGETQDRMGYGGKAEEIREELGERKQGAEGAEEEKRRAREVEMYLSVSNTLYKPSSCPSLSEMELPESGITVRGQGGVEERMGETEEEDEEEEVFESVAGEEVRMRTQGEGEVKGESEEVATEKKAVLVNSSFSFRDLGPEARIRRRGIRKTTERRREESLKEADEEEGLAGDRRTRIFTTPPEGEDCRSDSWGEVDLRNVLDTIGRRKRNSKFFNAAQLYQQYSEAAQNIEILRQARSDTIPVPVPSSSPPSSPTSSSPTSSSPTSSPPPARRPLPPLPPVPHPHSLSHSGSITSIKSLPLPEPPASHGRRSSSPRLSIANTQTLWQDLPGVRNSTELGEFSEDQRRLQEVRFEVVTSEASYCRSLDIVVDNFVKSKQLGALLTTQDRNWLFSRLADVRAISHSFLSKLEERVEEDTMHFSVCDIIARHCKRFRTVYVPYLTNQSYQDATYQRLMNENSRFKLVVEKLERSPVCQRLPLRSFLILPFQRITRIKLLVQNIVKRTAPGTEEVVQAIKALRMLEKLIQESNDSITQMKSIESLVSLSAKVDFECRTLPLVSQSRRMVREGPVTELMDFSLKETERTVYLHLFNDYLLLSLHKEGGRFTVIDHSPVSDLRAENCRIKLHSLQKNVFRLHLSNKALLLRTDTQSDKLRWISAVSRPHPEIDFSAAQDFKQMQCIRAFVAQQPDELSLEKADIILVHQQSSDGWVEGTRLSDRHRGWMPESHLETITNSRVQERNLSDALKLTTATAAV